MGSRLVPILSGMMGAVLGAVAALAVAGQGRAPVAPSPDPAVLARLDEIDKRIEALAREHKIIQLNVSDINDRQQQVQKALQAGAPTIEPVVQTFDEGIEDWVALTAPDNNLVGRIDHLAGGGRNDSGALRLRYTLTDGKIAQVLRAKQDLMCMTDITLWIRVLDQEATLYGGVLEADNSFYGQAFSITPDEGWKAITLRLRNLELFEGHTDENDRLDLNQIRGFIIMDTSVFENRKGKNTLLIDSFRAESRPDLDAGNGGEPGAVF